VDVVDGETRHHDVEGRIGKRQRAHVAGLDVDSVLHAFQRRVFIVTSRELPD
jgi:hypothetical protein